MVQDTWSFFSFFLFSKGLLEIIISLFVHDLDRLCSFRVRCARPNKILKWELGLQCWDKEIIGLKRFLLSVIHLISLSILVSKLHAELLWPPWGVHMLSLSSGMTLINYLFPFYLCQHWRTVNTAPQLALITPVAQWGYFLKSICLALYRRKSMHHWLECQTSSCI